MPTTDKKPKRRITPAFVKKPRKDPYIIDTLSATPVWQTGAIDLDGPWGWKKIEDGLFFSNILPKIQDLESMTWHEILGRNHHEINIELISKEAQKRLRELRLDDFETLVSLRLTARQRIWGIKINNIFKILWWDPKHEVYPSKRKYT